MACISKLRTASARSNEGARAISTDLSSCSLPGAEWGGIADQFARASATQSRRLAVDEDRASTDLGALLTALARVRSAGSPDAVLEIAPRELCAAGVFSRVLFSYVRGSVWLPDALFSIDTDGRVSRSDRSTLKRWVGGTLDITLASPLVEAEVARRRLPALVQDAQDESRTFRSLVERSAARDYVVAPIVASSSVIALIHADAGIRGRSLTNLDRDLLRMFADGVGLAHEYAGLIHRAERQRTQISEAVQAARDLVTAPADIPTVENRMAVLLDGPRSDRVPSAVERPQESPRDSARLSRLTSREREVLALLASGATNAQLADQLTVAESTVKSHVKHILHKLGAGNRAAAIACYLRETRPEERWTR